MFKTGGHVRCSQGGQDQEWLLQNHLQRAERSRTERLLYLVQSNVWQAGLSKEIISSYPLFDAPVTIATENVMTLSPRTRMAQEMLKKIVYYSVRFRGWWVIRTVGHTHAVRMTKQLVNGDGVVQSRPAFRRIF